ncbi:hypothetical protein D3C78_1709150 [compost metagenome]
MISLLSKKIVICAGLFVAIMLCGAVYNERLLEKRTKAYAPAPAHSPYAYAYIKPVELLYPLQPREYIRIIHPIDVELDSERLQ